MRAHVVLAAALAFLPCVARATESPMHAGELAHALDRLAGTARVLYVAAHPDDENTRLLAWLANSRHARAAYLSLTRGGGGQNLVGEEQGELLDLIRTEELLAARRLDGAEQWFSRMSDFGYSKTADETFATWGREEALADVVRVIRTWQPDVVIARFDERPPNHGHHTASAILAREAFAAAADPARFLDQIAAGLAPWRAERLLHNISPWRQEPVPESAIEVDVGGYDPRLGLSWGELAALSRSRHVSQGFGVAGERGPLVERFVPLLGSAPKSDLLESVPTSWARFGDVAAPLQSALDEARAALVRDHPERAVPALLKAHRAFAALPQGDVRVREGRRELDRIIASATGLFVRATAPAFSAVPGAEVKLDVEIVQRRPAAIGLRRVAFPGVEPQVFDGQLALHEKKMISQAFTVPAHAPVSAPYWLAEAPLPGRQVVRDASLTGRPLTPPALSVTTEFDVEGRSVVVEAPVIHAWVDPVRGERTRAFVIVPPATVTPTREAFLFPNGKATTVTLRVRAGADAVEGELRLPVPAGWSAVPATQAVKLAKRGDEIVARFEVTPGRAAGAADVAPVLRAAGKDWSWRESSIDHDHVPLQLVLMPSVLRLVPLELEVPPGRVGYIEGSGDTVAEDLAHAGFDVEVIDAETLRAGDLSRFAAIVVGIRAFNTREDVRAAQGRLMQWIEADGRLLVQYNTNNRLAPLTTPLGPHPFEIGRDRITDERAAMTPVRADHPLLSSPHAIGPADFDGWVQERGIYFASKWDERYEPLFSATDPGEQPLLGGTLVTTHGRGRFVYTGLAFFRQLPAGVPGAYRLFVNLIAPDATP